MKARFGSVVLFSSFVLVLASCGGGSSDNPSTTSDPSNVNSTDGDQSSGPVNDPTDTSSSEDQSSGTDTSTFDFSDQQQFLSAIQKTWSGPCYAEGENSYRLILNITDNRAYSDFHDYVGPGCTGIAVGYYYPLLIETFDLANLTTTASGKSAWEIDWTVVQQAAVSGEAINSPAGQRLYDVVSYDEGLVLTDADATPEPENRPNELAESALSERVITSVADITAESVQGVWVSNCHPVSDANLRVITSTINQDTATDDQAFYAGDDCTGEPYATRQDSWVVSFGETYTSLFGDSLIAYNKERVNSELISYDPAAGYDQPGLAEIGAGSKRFDAIAIEMDANDPVLMTTYCVVDNSDVCEKTAEGRSDMIDYNWSVRWTRP